MIDAPPIKFWRPEGLRPIPTPVRGGSLADLRRFVNIADDADFLLYQSFLVAALRPDRPFPLMVLNGSHG